MKSFIAAASALILSAGVAFAATSTSAPPPNDQNQANAQAASGPAAKARQEIEDSLAKAGFTDIKIMPESFLIRAKDKNGNPMMMVVNPDSMTAVEAIAPNKNGGNSNSSSSAANSPSGAATKP